MNQTWWKEAVVYQIYPRSFQDTTGNGVGDLRGIIQRLDHVKDLGVDVIWLSPVYESPNDDNGYDIADYRAIMAEFGTMDDFDELLDGVHARGMKLIMDLVANHTSDEHAWFEESRNWGSFFSGPAWELDATTGEYYLHLFTRKQPDLNWENPAVRKEIADVVEFWLEKGVDGFRMDVISLISKRGYDDTPYEQFNDTIANVYANGPRVHEFLQELYSNVISKYDVMTVGEGPGIDLDEGPKYVHEDRGELNMIFHFGHMFMDQGPGGKFDPVPIDFRRFKEVFVEWDRAMADGGWNSVFLCNHDFPRAVSRFGNDNQYWKESATLLATLLMTMRGTPYVYQGEEVGMTNVAFGSIESYRDVETLNAYTEQVLEGGRNAGDFLGAVHIMGRDNVRTPVQWDDSPNAGFCAEGVEPWIALNPNFDRINVATQVDDPESILSFYKNAIALRKAHRGLVYNDVDVWTLGHDQLFCYMRPSTTNGVDNGFQSYAVMHNMSDDPKEVSLPDGIVVDERLFSNLAELDKQVDTAKQSDSSEQSIDGASIRLEPWESVVWSVE
jgi:oligo-1,6-glucosidase